MNKEWREYLKAMTIEEYDNAVRVLTMCKMCGETDCDEIEPELKKTIVTCTQPQDKPCEKCQYRKVCPDITKSEKESK